MNLATNNHSTRRPRHSECGIALVITIILITVIAFMTIAFLTLSRREKGSVAISTDQLTAQMAADAGLADAEAKLVAPMLATTNAYNFDLLVPTNYINRAGFTNGVADPRNVNYDREVNGNPLTAAEALQNLANLLYSPRAPVFVTNRLYGSNEFRYYLDLNRNGRDDPSGLWPVISPDPANPYYDTNGDTMSQIIPGNTQSNYFAGDPEWIGVLAHPDQPHSATNFFVSRYTYLVVPAGKTLDVNYIHNQALNTDPGRLDPLGRGFNRDQGVGSWEINLAAFLYDLNTNMWGGLYFYHPLGGFRPQGTAFADAGGLYRYRVNGNNSLQSVSSLFPNAVNAFRQDMIDDYSSADLTSYAGFTLDPDVDLNRPWPGADNTNHFFTDQDFFDTSKTAPVGTPQPPHFTGALLAAGTRISSYDRYTFYRMLAQLGTDSSPERGRLNLNYVNVDPHGNIVPNMETNFISWNDPDLVNGNPTRGIPAFGRRGSEVFFMNAANQLLGRFSANWLARDYAGYTRTFDMNVPFGATNIPVFINGTNVYTPSLNRELQLVANIWDAMTNRTFPDGVPYPTVFRPQFERTANYDVYITNFVEVDNADAVRRLPLRDLSNTNVAANVGPNDLIFGVPLVVGARKGLPNFNEFAMESVVQITRKVQLWKHNPTGGPEDIYATNQMFVIGISNAIGTEFWNSYAANYRRPVDIYVTNYLTMSLTNDYGQALAVPPALMINPLNQIQGAYTNTPNNGWPGWSGRASDNSFLVPLRTTTFFLPDSAFQQVLNAQGRFVPVATAVANPNSDFYFPRWVLDVTNRLQAMVVDQATRRLVDYVQLNNLTGSIDLAHEIGQNRLGLYFDGLWATNADPRPGLPFRLGDQRGVLQQILISLGFGDVGDNWNSYGIGQATGQTRDKEIAKFLAFFSPNHVATYGGFSGTNYQQVATTPFNPSRKISLPITWQANDPLVHYMSGDLLYLDAPVVPLSWDLKNLAVHKTLENIGYRNIRYQPWDMNPKSNPNSLNVALKDPGAYRSDAWLFPTNKFPTIGWLGRVHRGTPWQTIYMKSGSVDATAWQKWTGNPSAYDALMTQPTNDWAIFDAFSTALNDNATRGQLSINQTNLAAWSALFGGMIVLQGDTNAVNAQGRPSVNYPPYVIQPAGVDPALLTVVNGINRERTRTVSNGGVTTYVHPDGTFSHLGDILSVPELTDKSPFLDLGAVNKTWGYNDAVYEWLPQQMLSLVRVGQPRFVVYSYGQTLRPANRSILTSGPFFGMCTNYQVVAEVATRTVLRIDGAPTNSHAVVESYNILPPN